MPKQSGFDLGAVMVGLAHPIVQKALRHRLGAKVDAQRGAVLKEFMAVADPKAKKMLENAIAHNDVQGVRQAAREGFERAYPDATSNEVVVQVATRTVFKPIKGIKQKNTNG